MQATIKVYAEAVLEHHTITLTRSEEDAYFVRLRENVDSYIPRWYAARFWTFEEAIEDFKQVVREAENSDIRWGMGGNLLPYHDNA